MSIIVYCFASLYLMMETSYETLKQDTIRIVNKFFFVILMKCLYKSATAFVDFALLFVVMQTYCCV